MKMSHTIHIQIKAKENSVLQKMIDQFICDRNKMRQLIQEDYNKKIEKQIKKIGHSRL